MNSTNKINKTGYLGANTLLQGIVTVKGSPVGFSRVEQETNPWIDTDRIFKPWEIAYNLGRFLPASAPPVIVYTDPQRYVAIYLTQKEMIARTLVKGKGKNSPQPTFLDFELRNGLKVRWDESLSIMLVDNWIYEAHALARSKKLMQGDKLLLKEHEVTLVAPV